MARKQKYAPIVESQNGSKLKEASDRDVPCHRICSIFTLYNGQEAEIRTDCGITEWFKIERSVRQGCTLSPYLFNIYALQWPGSRNTHRLWNHRMVQN